MVFLLLICSEQKKTRENIFALYGRIAQVFRIYASEIKTCSNKTIDLVRCQVAGEGARRCPPGRNQSHQERSVLLCKILQVGGMYWKVVL